MPATPSPAQSEASRQNGARSAGPATAAGKARSALNGVRHGLCGRTFFLLPDEDPAEFRRHEAMWLAVWSPRDLHEHQAAEAAIRAMWREIRADRLEAQVLGDLFAAGELARPSRGRGRQDGGLQGAEQPAPLPRPDRARASAGHAGARRPPPTPIGPYSRAATERTRKDHAGCRPDRTVICRGPTRRHGPEHLGPAHRCCRTSVHERETGRTRARPRAEPPPAPRPGRHEPPRRLTTAPGCAPRATAWR